MGGGSEMGPGGGGGGGGGGGWSGGVVSRLCHAMVLAVWVSSHFSGGTYSDVITPSSFKRAWGEGQPHDTRLVRRV